MGWSQPSEVTVGKQKKVWYHVVRLFHCVIMEGKRWMGILSHCWLMLIPPFCVGLPATQRHVHCSDDCIHHLITGFLSSTFPSLVVFFPHVLHHSLQCIFWLMDHLLLMVVPRRQPIYNTSMSLPDTKVSFWSGGHNIYIPLFPLPYESFHIFILCYNWGAYVSSFSLESIIVLFLSDFSFYKYIYWLPTDIP